MAIPIGTRPSRSTPTSPRCANDSFNWIWSIYIVCASQVQWHSCDKSEAQWPGRQLCPAWQSGQCHTRASQLSIETPNCQNSNSQLSRRRAADLACEWTWLTVVVIINVQLLLSGGGCYYQWPLVVTLVSSRSRCPSSSPAPPDQPFFSLWVEILFSEILLLVFDLRKSNFSQKLLSLPIADVKAFFPLMLWMTVKYWAYKH